VDVGLLREVQLVEERVDVLLDRALGEEQAGGDRRVVLALRHVVEDLALALGELRERRVRHPILRGHERLHDLGIEDRPALRDLVERAHDLLDVAHALLQEVPEPRRAVLEEVVRVRLLRELRQDDDADVRVLLADALRGVDALGRVRRRHADVGEDGLRAQLLDRRQELVEGGRGAEEVDAVRCLEQRARSLADEVVILGEHDAHHARMLHAAVGAP